MKEERTTPLRQRMIEDMRIRGMGDKAQKSHIRAIKDFAAFLGRSPDTATSEDLRAYQLHMADTGVSPSTFNVRIVALRFFFGMTCGREEMKRYMQFRTEPRKLPVVFSVQEVSDILMAAPGPGLKYRAALSISYGAGLRAAEVCNLKVSDIDSDRMLIHVGQGPEGPQGHAVARPAGVVAGMVARGASRRLAVSGQAQDQPDLTAPAEPRLHFGQAHGRRQEARDTAHVAP
jgi:site-specific recombinase XerD